MRQRRAGHLTVITGPMFSGKTGVLLRRIRRARRQGRGVTVVTHRIDDRYGHGVIASHDGVSETALAVAGPAELRDLLSARPEAPDVLAVDEAQFFGAGLTEVVGEVLARGVAVDVAGLCQTFGARPFEPVATLMTQAEEIIKLTAVCEICGADAAYHQLTAGDVDTSGPVVGGAEMYEARCRAHYTGD